MAYKRLWILLLIFMVQMLETEPKSIFSAQKNAKRLHRLKHSRPFVRSRASVRYVEPDNKGVNDFVVNKAPEVNIENKETFPLEEPIVIKDVMLKTDESYSSALENELNIRQLMEELIAKSRLPGDDIGEDATLEHLKMLSGAERLKVEDLLKQYENVTNVRNKSEVSNVPQNKEMLNPEIGIEYAPQVDIQNAKIQREELLKKAIMQRYWQQILKKAQDMEAARQKEKVESEAEKSNNTKKKDLSVIVKAINKGNAAAIIEIKDTEEVQVDNKDEDQIEAVGIEHIEIQTEASTAITEEPPNVIDQEILSSTARMENPEKFYDDTTTTPNYQDDKNDEDLLTATTDDDVLDSNTDIITLFDVQDRSNAIVRILHKNDLRPQQMFGNTPHSAFSDMTAIKNEPHPEEIVAEHLDDDTLKAQLDFLQQNAPKIKKHKEVLNDQDVLQEKGVSAKNDTELESDFRRAVQEQLSSIEPNIQSVIDFRKLFSMPSSRVNVKDVSFQQAKDDGAVVPLEMPPSINLFDAEIVIPENVHEFKGLEYYHSYIGEVMKLKNVSVDNLTASEPSVEKAHDLEAVMSPKTTAASKINNFSGHTKIFSNEYENLKELASTMPINDNVTENIQSSTKKIGTEEIIPQPTFIGDIKEKVENPAKNDMEPMLLIQNKTTIESSTEILNVGEGLLSKKKSLTEDKIEITMTTEGTATLDITNQSEASQMHESNGSSALKHILPAEDFTIREILRNITINPKENMTEVADAVTEYSTFEDTATTESPIESINGKINFSLHATGNVKSESYEVNTEYSPMGVAETNTEVIAEDLNKSTTTVVKEHEQSEESSTEPTVLKYEDLVDKPTEDETNAIEETTTETVVSEAFTESFTESATENAESKEFPVGSTTLDFEKEEDHTEALVFEDTTLKSELQDFKDYGSLLLNMLQNARTIMPGVEMKNRTSDKTPESQDYAENLKVHEEPLGLQMKNVTSDRISRVPQDYSEDPDDYRESLMKLKIETTSNSTEEDVPMENLQSKKNSVGSLEKLIMELALMKHKETDAVETKEITTRKEEAMELDETTKQVEVEVGLDEMNQIDIIDRSFDETEATSAASTEGVTFEVAGEQSLKNKSKTFKKSTNEILERTALLEAPKKKKSTTEAENMPTVTPIVSESLVSELRNKSLADESELQAKAADMLEVEKQYTSETQDIIATTNNSMGEDNIFLGSEENKKIIAPATVQDKTKITASLPLEDVGVIFIEHNITERFPVNSNKNFYNDISQILDSIIKEISFDDLASEVQDLGAQNETKFGNDKDRSEEPTEVDNETAFVMKETNENINEENIDKNIAAVVGQLNEVFAEESFGENANKGLEGFGEGAASNDEDRLYEEVTQIEDEAQIDMAAETAVETKELLEGIEDYLLKDKKTNMETLEKSGILKNAFLDILSTENPVQVEKKVVGEISESIDSDSLSTEDPAYIKKEVFQEISVTVDSDNIETEKKNTDNYKVEVENVTDIYNDTLREQRTETPLIVEEVQNNNGEKFKGIADINSEELEKQDNTNAYKKINGAEIVSENGETQGQSEIKFEVKVDQKKTAEEPSTLPSKVESTRVQEDLLEDKDPKVEEKRTKAVNSSFSEHLLAVNNEEIKDHILTKVFERYNEDPAGGVLPSVVNKKESNILPADEKALAEPETKVLATSKNDEEIKDQTEGILAAKEPLKKQKTEDQEIDNKSPLLIERKQTKDIIQKTIEPDSAQQSFSKIASIVINKDESKDQLKKAPAVESHMVVEKTEENLASAMDSEDPVQIPANEAKTAVEIHQVKEKTKEKSTTAKNSEVFISQSGAPLEKIQVKVPVEANEAKIAVLRMTATLKKEKDQMKESNAEEIKEPTEIALAVEKVIDKDNAEEAFQQELRDKEVVDTEKYQEELPIEVTEETTNREKNEESTNNDEIEAKKDRLKAMLDEDNAGIKKEELEQESRSELAERVHENSARVKEEAQDKALVKVETAAEGEASDEKFTQNNTMKKDNTEGKLKDNTVTEVEVKEELTALSQIKIGEDNSGDLRGKTVVEVKANKIGNRTEEETLMGKSEQANDIKEENRNEIRTRTEVKLSGNSKTYNGKDKMISSITTKEIEEVKEKEINSLNDIGKDNVINSNTKEIEKVKEKENLTMEDISKVEKIMDMMTVEAIYAEELKEALEKAVPIKNGAEIKAEELNQTKTYDTEEQMSNKRNEENNAGKVETTAELEAEPLPMQNYSEAGNTVESNSEENSKKFLETINENKAVTKNQTQLREKDKVSIELEDIREKSAKNSTPANAMEMANTNENRTENRTKSKEGINKLQTVATNDFSSLEETAKEVKTAKKELQTQDTVEPNKVAEATKVNGAKIKLAAVKSNVTEEATKVNDSENSKQKPKRRRKRPAKKNTPPNAERNTKLQGQQPLVQKKVSLNNENTTMEETIETVTIDRGKLKQIEINIVKNENLQEINENADELRIMVSNEKNATRPEILEIPKLNETAEVDNAQSVITDKATLKQIELNIDAEGDTEQETNGLRIILSSMDTLNRHDFNSTRQEVNKDIDIKIANQTEKSSNNKNQFAGTIQNEAALPTTPTSSTSSAKVRNESQTKTKTDDVEHTKKKNHQQQQEQEQEQEQEQQSHNITSKIQKLNEEVSTTVHCVTTSTAINVDIDVVDKNNPETERNPDTRSSAIKKITTLLAGQVEVDKNNKNLIERTVSDDNNKNATDAGAADDETDAEEDDVFDDITTVHRPYDLSRYHSDKQREKMGQSLKVDDFIDAEYNDENAKSAVNDNAENHDGAADDLKQHGTYTIESQEIESGENDSGENDELKMREILHRQSIADRMLLEALRRVVNNVAKNYAANKYVAHHNVVIVNAADSDNVDYTNAANNKVAYRNVATANAATKYVAENDAAADNVKTAEPSSTQTNHYPKIIYRNTLPIAKTPGYTKIQPSTYSAEATFDENASETFASNVFDYSDVTPYHANAPIKNVADEQQHPITRWWNTLDHTEIKNFLNGIFNDAADEFYQEITRQARENLQKTSQQQHRVLNRSKGSAPNWLSNAWSLW